MVFAESIYLSLHYTQVTDLNRNSSGIMNHEASHSFESFAIGAVTCHISDLTTQILIMPHPRYKNEKQPDHMGCQSHVFFISFSFFAQVRPLLWDVQRHRTRRLEERSLRYRGRFRRRFCSSAPLTPPFWFLAPRSTPRS